jgi:hypothetical protein
MVADDSRYADFQATAKILACEQASVDRLSPTDHDKF